MLLKTKIIATNRTVEHKVQQAVLPTLSGEIGILPNHIPILTGLETGVVRLKIDGRWLPIIIVDGIAKVNNNELVLIVRILEEIQDLGGITLDQAKQALNEATEACTKATNPKDRLLATINFRRTLARYQALAFSSNSNQL
jgi:ATP synthase F1 epsilon subunit